MLITTCKSLIVEPFQGNYLKTRMDEVKKEETFQVLLENGEDAKHSTNLYNRLSTGIQAKKKETERHLQAHVSLQSVMFSNLFLFPMQSP